MTDLNETLTQILNDPGSMQQIMELASGLGLRPEQLQGQPADPRQEALVQALLPYLRPGRQRRLERAMEIARMSRLAGAALQTAARSEEKEDRHV